MVTNQFWDWKLVVLISKKAELKNKETHFINKQIKTIEKLNFNKQFIYYGKKH